MGHDLTDRFLHRHVRRYYGETWMETLGGPNDILSTSDKDPAISVLFDTHAFEIKGGAAALSYN